MKKILAVLLVLSFAVAVAAPLAAEARTRKKPKAYYAPPRSEQRSSGSDYQEFIADKLPIGSSQWWAQMDREGRGGQSRAN
jgi:hypothetical protein